MIVSELLSNFELHADDSTELSVEDELALLNKVYKQVCSDRPWEFLKTAYTGTTNGTNNITLPTDFDYFIGEDVYINSAPYKRINIAERMVETGNFVFVDTANSKLYFSDIPVAGLDITATYIKTPADLLITESPIIPTKFQNIIPYLMVCEDATIQQNPDKNIINENKLLADKILTDMRYWNAQFE